ncbi:hypothetical protein D9Q98_006351 [Chlorella vulgaris]|uniref:Uncharacterized protein n=1 Tax=Chlorella vulgaris TaxID=3077 RepID=A0A9D4YUX6_CHLVU|nr:hypothetical protein D9Q98_006351 [Chlorella vulgaris]
MHTARTPAGRFSPHSVLAASRVSTSRLQRSLRSGPASRQLRSILVFRGACSAALPPLFFSADDAIAAIEWSTFVWFCLYIGKLYIDTASYLHEVHGNTAVEVAAIECQTAVEIAAIEWQAAQDAAVATLEAKLEAQAQEALRATRELQEEVAMLRVRVDKAEAKVKVCLPACNNQGLGVLPSAQQSGSFWLQALCHVGAHSQAGC